MASKDTVFCNHDGVIDDEMTDTLDDTGNTEGARESDDAHEPLEPETCDVKKKRKAPKMSKGKKEAAACLQCLENKRTQRMVVINSFGAMQDTMIVWHWNRCKSEDRLSGLPNDIIISILSRLTLKEAVRTSVLSGRWKNLWTCTTNLGFHYSDRRSLSLYIPFVGNREKAPLVKRIRFVAWVNQVLALHQGQNVDRFEISCELYGRIRKAIINEWVEFALRERVKRLKLDFTGKVSYNRGNYSLKKSMLRKNSLDSLTFLDLKNVDVTGKSISYILVNCPFLEGLCVEKSYTLVDLIVPGPLPQLKALEIKNCARLNYLKICAINVKSFAYHGSFIPVIFEKVPHLVDASYGGCYASFVLANMRQKFSSYVTCLKLLVLKISGFHHTYWNDQVLPEFPVLENLRKLDLRLCNIEVGSIINCCASLLRCPMLERLSLKVSTFSFGSDSRPERKEKYLNSYLRVLELADFEGKAEEAKIALFMVGSLPSLQQVIIRLPNFDGACLEYFERIEKSVSKSAKQLLKIMPATAELIMSAYPHKELPALEVVW
ncbi:hypothetical protein Cgig2_024183 [Carnegiea gigantea]|uniref:F-box domain-containing protein n=1 Tax=Carnegiea gigantea TaxID=171969 RepID=A0A9Q1KB14_9CARY|nr:hypothetical protein Cgig2_024183 [Carnegiea gigantea]